MNGLSVLLNNLLYILSRYAMIGVLLHLVYKISELHLQLLIILFLIQQTLNLLLSSKLDKMREQIKGTDNGTSEEETRSSQD